MKLLHFIYRMDVDFSYPITDHSFTLKCVPYSSPFQNITIQKQQVSPVSWISDGKDSFGNAYLYGKCTELHNHFSVYVEGDAKVYRDTHRVNRGGLPDMMGYPSKLTECSGDLITFAEEFRPEFGAEQMIDFEHAIYRLMQRVYESMEYCPGTTQILTTASEAYAQKQGVCQDYSHIMLAVFRYYHIPCQYVAGFLQGEGASHAWVGVYHPKTGYYYEIDPTNHKWVDNDYISIMRGKDSSDCLMNKGIYRGLTNELQTVSVSVKEIEERF